MRSVVTIITPPSGPQLLTLDDVKLELGVTDTLQDDLLNAIIVKASQIAATYCDLVLAAQTVSETFRHSLGPGSHHFRPRFHHHEQIEEGLSLVCAPVTSITSVSVDGSILDSALYEMNDFALFRLNDAGYPAPWHFSKFITVIYSSGFTVGVNVPGDVQAAVMSIVRNYYSNSVREDPNLKRRRTEGVSELEWYVPPTPQTVLPVTVSGLLDPYKASWKWMR